MRKAIISLYLCSISLLFPPSASSEGFYTIQTCTYTPASLRFAKSHFNQLSRILKEGDRNYLRIERGKKYITIRIGKFSELAEAKKLLEKVKALSPDAFILKELNFEKIEVIRLYGETLETLKEEKSTTEIETLKSPSLLKEYYTLQIGNFLTQEEAKKELDALSKKLKVRESSSLRIERSGSYFSLRLGRFETYSAVKEFLSSVSNLIPEAVIIIGKSEEEQQKTFEDKSVQTKRLITVDQEKQKREIELFLNDVSNQYYKEQYGKVAEMLKEGISRWPDNADLYAWYGAALLNMKDHENALSQYRKAVEISPQVPDYHAGVGVSLLNIYMERAKESIEAFKKALEIDPNNVSALEGLGFVYVSIGKKDLAMEIYTHLATLNKDAANRLYQVITLGVDWEKK